jgi:hypothetical protein
MSATIQFRDLVVIRWYRKNQYGVTREFVHPACEGDAKVLSMLTGQKTIDGRIRELVRDLTRGGVTFEEVIAP